MPFSQDLQNLAEAYLAHDDGAWRALADALEEAGAPTLAGRVRRGDPGNIANAIKSDNAAWLPMADYDLVYREFTRLGGKPDPEGFLLAANRLSVPIGQCLVFEDSPAGVAAAKASGAHVAIVGGHVTAVEGQYSLQNYLEPAR